MPSRNNGVFVVGHSGVIAMNAAQHFEAKIYKKLGLRPVFRLKHEFFEKTHKFKDEVREINGHKIKCTVMEMNGDERLLDGYPTDAEVDEFIRLRETFIAEELLRKVSWDEFKYRCEREKITDVIQRHRPCEAPDHQCNMDCPVFANCDQAANTEYLYKEEKDYNYW